MEKKTNNKHTPGPWMVAKFREEPGNPPTVEEIKNFLCKSVDRTVECGLGTDPDFWVVLKSDDPTDPVFTAITGNGTASEANARLIAMAPDLFVCCKFIAEKLAPDMGWGEDDFTKYISNLVAMVEGRK